MAVLEDEQILKVLATTSSEGATLGDIADHIDLAQRTLQRRLKRLIEEGKIRREGESRATRYFLVVTTAPILASSEALEVKRLLTLPERSRHPVGYRREFLDHYQPNETFYLSESTRAHLRSRGLVSTTSQPAGTYARQIFDRLLIDLSWNSSRLEGNTYSLLETERLLAQGIVADERGSFETQMILNHKAAIEFLVESAEYIGFNRLTILNLHALLSENLLSDPAAGGRLRSYAVGITGSVFYPLDNPHQLREAFDSILEKAEAIHDPFEQSFFVLVQLPYLQPFADVNKRVSRLAANIPFIQQNLCPLSFIDVTPDDYVQGMLGVYELNNIALLRDVFVSAYERSAARYAAIRDSLGEPDRFRMQWRSELKEVIGEVVRKPLNPDEASHWIQSFAQDLPIEQRSRFIEVAEAELSSLHEGNFARYRVRPSEFAAWRALWR
ncbi:MAG: Fic family protein [Bradymonadaceae bacterium]|nr:Fic family protein [Lujinxingiaceae bacterium]